MNNYKSLEGINKIEENLQGETVKAECVNICIYTWL